MLSQPRKRLAFSKLKDLRTLASGLDPCTLPPMPASALSRKTNILLLLPLLLSIVSGFAAETNDAPFGLERRVPWTTSHVVGSPDPPLPYSVEKTFTNIQWRAPLYVAAEPGTDFLFVILQGGEKDRPSKLLRLRDADDAATTETILTVSNRLLYSVAFHPGYRTNGILYLFSNGPTTRGERTNRVTRYTKAGKKPTAWDAAPYVDPDSEKLIIEWRSAGHDGGGMAFGRDGTFYISTGDGTSDSDAWNSGQTVDDLLGGVLRIDVDRPDEERAYSIPKDNPFVGWTNARPELWAYGLRNPWRLTVDEKTGHVWVGSNGQDLWETIHFIRRGENYGWSVYEGSHPFYLNRKVGPTPPVAPTIEHHHAEARSLTGGVVYYGERFPDLEGAYIYGDYSSGTIWGARHDGSRLTWHKELARTQLQIAAFAVTSRGELLIVDHGGGIFRLVRTPEAPRPDFPSRLSETGIFTSTKDHKVQPGVLPYSVNAPGWADGAHIERFVGLPGETRIDLTNGGWALPEGAILMQTLSLQNRRVETRLLTRQNGQWAGYSYRWDDTQSDATLVDRNGEDRDLAGGASSASPGARAEAPQPSTLNPQPSKWRFPSRTECMACHSRAANFVLGFTELQLNRTNDYGTVRDSQLRTLEHIGLFVAKESGGSSSANPFRKAQRAKEKLVDPYDSTQDLEARARSYLHVNCSVCHIEAGGGNAKMELGISTKAERMNVFDARPQHDTFGVANAMLVAPGETARSVLFQRVSRRGRGQMPPLVTTRVDDRAVALLREWIDSMKPTQTFVRDWKMEDLLPGLAKLRDGRSIDAGRTAFRQVGCNQCHRFRGDGGTVGPELGGERRLSPQELLESIVSPSKVITEGYAATEIETKSGDAISGRVEREDDRVVVIRPPLATEAVTIEKGQIKQRTLSKTSNMPSGMLNTLTENQVLDLLAYLLSDPE
jgi:putative heme-binding domain-containing protein